MNPIRPYFSRLIYSAIRCLNTAVLCYFYFLMRRCYSLPKFAQLAKLCTVHTGVREEPGFIPHKFLMQVLCFQKENTWSPAIMPCGHFGAVTGTSIVSSLSVIS